MHQTDLHAACTGPLCTRQTSLHAACTGPLCMHQTDLHAACTGPLCTRQTCTQPAAPDRLACSLLHQTDLHAACTGPLCTRHVQTLKGNYQRTVRVSFKEVAQGELPPPPPPPQDIANKYNYEVYPPSPWPYGHVIRELPLQDEIPR